MDDLFEVHFPLRSYWEAGYRHSICLGLNTTAHAEQLHSEYGISVHYDEVRHRIHCMSNADVFTLKMAFPEYVLKVIDLDPDDEEVVAEIVDG